MRLNNIRARREETDIRGALRVEAQAEKLCDVTFPALREESWSTTFTCYYCAAEKPVGG